MLLMQFTDLEKTKIEQMTDFSKIAINFSPLKSDKLIFSIYRKERKSSDKKPEDSLIFGSKLPEKKGDREYKNYWVSFSEFTEGKVFECNRMTNLTLTKSYILWILKKVVNENLDDNQYLVLQHTKYKRLYFILNSYPEGKETVWLEPYYLEKEDKFGFLIDFKFLKNTEIEFNRKIQILSLSLNSIGRSNTSFYSDKYMKIRLFAKQFYKKVFSNSIIDFDPVTELPYRRLIQKRFIVKNNREVDTQSEMRGIGPLRQLSDTMNIFFLHKVSERKIIASFYSELQKELESIFGVHVVFNGHKCEEISDQEILNLKNIIKSGNYSNPLVLILKKNQEEENDLYFFAKYEFSKDNIPVQFINYETLENKYSVRDFSLQMFSKVGGVPWIIKPISDTTLIIGLAQSIRFKDDEGNRVQDRYYAYSILLESTGLYHSIDIVSTNNAKEEYLNQLKDKIITILENHANTYSRIAIHAPFKISNEEIERIKEAVEKTSSNIEFVVLRINVDNKYFGYNKEINNLTPFEGTCTALGNKQYLLWSEGLNSNDLKSKKRYSGPIFIDFMLENKKGIDHYSYIQELLSLSGMNWRAYNSKSIPISVQYCDLVTEFVREFRERGYPDLDAASLQPWFL